MKKINKKKRENQLTKNKKEKISYQNLQRCKLNISKNKNKMFQITTKV